MDGHRSDTIPTNLRLLLVLEQVAEADGPVTPTEVNAELGLPKPTIHRLFATLLEEGFLQRDMGGRTYLPGPRLRRMSGGVLSASPIQSARKAILRKLSGDLGETCNIALPDGDSMVYLERQETEWPLRIQLPPGTRVPLYCTASGKMYLSTLAPRMLDAYLSAVTLEARTPRTYSTPEALREALDAIRDRGHSEDRGEFMEDMIAVAVPVLDANGRLLATLSVHAPTSRMSLEDARGCLPRLVRAASDLAALVTD
ncbi:IclR family transcriptional regulator [Jannaschia seohaensis]|uniref:DNA-binding IclR family transcriptional regulator n=1 Tax=Jannaschia seohaensis TaxID=475081 RepID=A0A2Y9C3G9_9RHOB|nr:IclR family transcriptional regulator [Jannaschia seohaensis]PWJ11472.1 DNA-binding IclR family transcriptional regulator [Jannaschia seohaensis]SSA51452.1 DNA-binding transcriptional regulator, IclR family [Jannaschia seohaensis]